MLSESPRVPPLSQDRESGSQAEPVPPVSVLVAHVLPTSAPFIRALTTDFHLRAGRRRDCLLNRGKVTMNRRTSPRRHSMTEEDVDRARVSRAYPRRSPCRTSEAK